MFRRHWWREKYDFGEFDRQITMLLEQGFDRGFLIITDVETDLYVQLRKYIRRKGDYGIQIGFPKAPMLITYYSAVVQYAKDNHLNFFFIPAEKG